MKRIIYLLPVLALLISLPINGCNEQDEGACVSGSGITRVCRDNINEYMCGQFSGTLYPDKTCAELGFGRNTAPKTSIDSTTDSCNCQQQ